MNIAFDIDGVLTDFETFLTTYGSKYFKTTVKNIALSQINDNDVADMFQCTLAEEDAFWEEYIEFYCTKYPSRIGMAEIMAELQKEHRIYIITNRASGSVTPEVMQPWVLRWLQKERIPYDKIVFNKGSKLTPCLENKIDIMVEDSPKHISELSKRLQCICFNSYYNASCADKNVIRCYSAYDLLEHIRAIAEIAA